MATTETQSIHKQLLQEFTELINDGTVSQVQEKLQQLHPAEIAHLIESLPQDSRESIRELIAPEIEGEVLIHLQDEIRARLISEMDESKLVEVAQTLDNDDLVDILVDFPDEVIPQVLDAMDEQRRQRVEAAMAYPEDTAGGLMNTDTITVRTDISLDVVLRYLRRLGAIPESTDSLFVVDREGTYLGAISLTQLLISDPNQKVQDLLSKDIEAIDAFTSEKDVAALFTRRDLISAPVVTSEGRLLGRITIDDVVDVIREDADHSLMSMAGLSEEDDMFAPVITSSRRRTVWLGINLLTALLASWVIGHFEDTIEKLVALAVLMPIVASMGGIAGSQTLTIVIRGIAVGKISGGNALRLLNKETLVGMLNGVIWALIVAGIAVLWFQDYQLGAIIGAAMLINLVVAAAAGATIPIILQKLHIDPALAGGVVLTTVTDVVGFLAFLGLAATFIV
ncbi:MAG: magnesium transporter [Gammaproteobacteria bacterium]|jgi:magnesium transporter|nr:magnesium transporter [Gammaproteobacteria bacterium]